MAPQPVMRPPNAIQSQILLRRPIRMTVSTAIADSTTRVLGTFFESPKIRLILSLLLSPERSTPAGALTNFLYNFIILALEIPDNRHHSIRIRIHRCRCGLGWLYIYGWRYRPCNRFACA